jgi:hypothetical protein
MRTGLFAAVGVAFFTHWTVSDPGYEETASQSEWPNVLGFSGVILGLALALAVFGRMVGGRPAFVSSLVAAAGAALSSLANVVEDGLQHEWAFLAFVAGSAVLLAGLVALAGAAALGGRGWLRLLGLVPAVTAAAIALYVAAGGPVLLVTWLAAAAVALAIAQAQRPSAASTSSP